MSVAVSGKDRMHGREHRTVSKVQGWSGVSDGDGDGMIPRIRVFKVIMTKK